MFSAVFRAVEGDVLNETLRGFHAHNPGGQVVLPLYDGMLVAAPCGAEGEVQAALQTAADRAVRDLGIPGLRAVVRSR